jgi:hypothetical protein
MLKGQTIIGRVLARCPRGTEPLSARLRLSHLFGGADLAPRGFPPHAVLVVRRAQPAGRVALGAHNPHAPRAAWERELREQVTAFWRRAARPVRGRVPASAEAVLFADESEWMAALGLAAARREVGRHWCWRDSRGASPSQTMVRTWAASPRFVPAALVRLAQWGEAARVLGTLQPSEAGELLAALRSEFKLPHHARASGPHAARTATRRGSQAVPAGREGVRASGVGEAATAASSEVGAERGVRLEEGAAGGASVEESREQVPPWRRWLPPDGGECVRLHTAARSLLSFAAALFHAPSLARSREFAEEVAAFEEGVAAQAHPSPEDARANAAQSAKPRAHDADDGRADARTSLGDARRGAAHADAAPVASREAARSPSPDADAQALKTRGEASTDRAEEPPAVRPARDVGESHDSGTVEDVAEEEGDLEKAEAAPWAALGGCETRLGGALFLLNLLVGLRLPECFDEAYALSEHVTGWGLTELLARSLLGDVGAEFEDDPLWGALAHLDGRAGGEPPARGLRVGASYRVPARWLKLFAPREGEAVWLAAGGEGRLVLTHAAGFPVAVLPLAGREPSEAAAQFVDEYRAHGLRVSLRFKDGGGRVEDETEDVRRWMSWTFPFLKYALRRSLDAEGGGPGGDESARALLVRRGRLYCTDTHVDLVLEPSGLSFEARRAGLDASPGWVRDLMRVVAFHYE